MAAAGPEGGDTLYLVFNSGGAVDLTLPETAPAWQLDLSTADPDAAASGPLTRLTMPAHSVFVFAPSPTGGSL